MQPHDTTLADKIVELRRKNLIPKRFRLSDVLAVLAGEYADDYIKTALANFCDRTGDYVKRGATARFRRVERGLYELLSN
jgi:hypothetical protein